MGKKGGWISTVKKVLTFESKDTKEKKLKKNDATEKSENEHNMHAYSVAIATAEAAEAAAAAARAAAAEVARLTARQPVISREESSAIKIQSAFRAHLARRALRALKGLARLQSLIQSQSVQRQSVITLQCMQTLSRLQSQIRSRRVKMSHENLSLLQQQLQQKFETEPDSLKPTTNVGENWNASAASKEQIEAKLQNKEEAAKKRERALAYANSHRVRKSPLKPDNPTYLDQTDPFWGWSWLERWMATRPWENKTEQNIIPARAHPPKPKTSLTTLSPKARSSGPKTRPTGPKGSSFKPNENRRHTIAGSPVRGDDNNKNGKSVIFSNSVGRTGVMKKAKQGKGSFGSAKKQISYSSGSSGARRHSGPPKVDATS